MTRSQLLFSFAVLFGSVVCGFGVAYGDIYFAAAVTAVILAAPLLLMPIERILWGGWVLTFFVTGQLQYFAHLSKAFWLPYLFGALLFMRLPIDLMAMRKAPATVMPTPNPLKMWVFVFFATAAFSTVVNASPPPQVLLAIKEYLFLWGVVIVLGLGLASPRYFSCTWLAMLWLVPLHIPFVIYQRFVVAAGRKDAASFDAIVGIFGGTAETGGATGAMGLFLLFAMMLAISYWRAGKLHFLAVAGIWITALISVLMAEVKIVILLLPIVIGLLYRRELLRKPMHAVGMLLVAVAFTAALSAVYAWQFGTRGNAYQGPFGYIEKAIETNANGDFFNAATGEIGRIASIKYWWSQHSMDDPVTLLIGHGMGATRYGTVMGEQAKKNPFYKIDRSSAVIYLWETGLLGVASFTGFLLAAALMAARVTDNVHLGLRERAVLAAITPMLILQPLVLIYDTHLSAGPQMQMLLMLMVGQVLFSTQRAARFAKNVVDKNRARTNALG